MSATAALRRAAALALVVGSLSLVPSVAPSEADNPAAWSQTKTLTRSYFTGDSTSGYTPATDQRDVTVSVDKNTDLQTRERIHVTWSGAHPTGGRPANPFGEKGMGQEYPVVIMECRGLDDPSLPSDKQVRPETCWTSTFSQRTQSQSTDSAVWLDDAAASDADRGQLSGITRDRLPDKCVVQASQSYHVTPFVGADGKFYAGCGADFMPPQAAAGSVDPPNEIEAFTSLDGTGSADFEVRTEIENEALGCSDTVACSLVVIPINGISCAAGGGLCNSTGYFEPGSNNFEMLEGAAAVSPALWWSASNWKNRFSIPLTFAPPPDTCSLLASGKPVPFYGSELLSQAALQWAPAYCLNKQRFNWQANTMPDEAAFTLLQNGAAPAAQVTMRRQDDDGVGYAPTAVTGFGIAYAIDKPGNQGEFKDLRLTARLLAKLLTESYPGSPFGAGRPGLEKNPYSINLDPEFQALNPNLDTRFSEAASTLLALNTGSDVITQLTAYLDDDPAARAFLDGKPDPWGMVVNPAYKKLKLPLDTWPLLDTWTPQNTGQDCLDANPAPYLPKIAAPVSSLRLISTAMLLSWPNVNTACSRDPQTLVYKLGRTEQQGIGQRFMLGLVTLGDAARYGLNVASLEAGPGHYVAADSAGLAAGVALSQQPQPGKKATAAQRQQAALLPFELDMKKVRRSATAYPGTMVVYTAAKTHGLAKADAKKVAQFIQISTTEGQRPGRGNGQLPAGYLPITGKGATKKLFKTAGLVRAAVLAQKEPPAAKPAATPAPTGPTVAPVVAAAPPSAGTPPGAAAPATSSAPVAAGEQEVAQTAAVSSSLGNGLLPLLLVGGIAAALLSAATRIVLRLRGLR